MTTLDLMERPRMSETNGNGNGRKLTPALLLQIAAYLVAVALAYGALSERIARLETQSEELRGAVGEIRSDVKQLLRERR
jgi:hypothetical protein